MNLVSLLAHIPLTLYLPILASVVLPALSALLSREHWDPAITGILTLGLSTATGFITEWAHAGADFHLQAALAAALLSWGVAALAQSKVLSGTDIEARLLAVGNTSPIGQGEPDPTVGIDPDLGADSHPTSGPVEVGSVAALPRPPVAVPVPVPDDTPVTVPDPT